MINQTETLRSCLKSIDEISKKQRLSREFHQWMAICLSTISDIFGSDSYQLCEFKKIQFEIKNDEHTRGPESRFDLVFQRGLSEAKTLLEQFIETADNLPNRQLDITSEEERIVKICSRFHIVAEQLTRRHNGRQTLLIENEYDVQDLMHALLRVDFEDIREEEWTPSYAGGGSRVDFLLKKEKIVIEIKKTRTGLSGKEIGEQLIIDIQRYQAHPDCRLLVCFVYDPVHKINNPRGIETDLSKQYETCIAKVIIAP